MAEIFKSQKHVFWQALILAVFIFSMGVLLGFVLENTRIGEINTLYVQAEIDLFDIKIQNEIYSLSDINCDKAVKENIDFADRVYEEAKLLQRYEDASRLSEDLIIQHKKYDLLRTLFWINAIKIKNRCKSDYHNVVYFYDYQNAPVEILAKQAFFSNLLSEIKQEEGNKVMLIPIAGDNDITSISLMMDLYGVKEEELPVILIDEKIKINEVDKKEDILKLLR